MEEHGLSRICFLFPLFVFGCIDRGPLDGGRFCTLLHFGFTIEKAFFFRAMCIIGHLFYFPFFSLFISLLFGFGYILRW